ncbi:MAG: Phosphocholine transferase AnkX [Wolbachia endosymbiont of Ctenocephalides orientis wCori]|nr:MAG: Phosphocholine transferase AnkX [Wolbachia endosymbiont of Ctenocephalides orientis wCori]
MADLSEFSPRLRELIEQYPDENWSKSDLYAFHSIDKAHPRKGDMILNHLLFDMFRFHPVNLKVLKIAIEAGADINGMNHIYTPLHTAVERCNLEIVKLLVEKGADINIKSIYQGVQSWDKPGGFTPLELGKTKGCSEDILYFLLPKNERLLDSIKKNNVEKVKSLIEIEKGVDLNHKVDGYTPLHWAKSAEMVILLVKSGADVNTKDNSGYTVLHSYHSPEVVDYLINNGKADINVKDNDGWTPLHWAARQGYQATVELQIKYKANVNARNNDGDKPVGLAKLHNHKVIEQLLKDHSNPTELLCSEIKKSNIEEVRLMIERDGADVNATDSQGKTPLQFARSVEMADLLVNSGAVVDAKDRGGFTPLHWAARNELLEVAEFLIGKGADVNAEVGNGTGDHLLHFAARKGLLAVIELLIKHNADINVQDKQEKTPLHLAMQNDKKDIVEILLNHDKINVIIKDKDGLTPLRWAKDVGIVVSLIEKGANVNAKDNDGNTLLHLAAKDGHTAVVELLIGKGVDITANNSNEMPLNLTNDEAIRAKLEKYAKSKELDKLPDLEKNLQEAEEKLTELLKEKDKELENFSKLQKELRDLKGEHPVLEKVLSDMKEEFSKCNLAKSLDKAVQGLEEIKGELSPSYYAYPSGSGLVSFEDTINTILNDTKLLDNASMKSKVFKTVEGMLEMLKTCSAQSEDKLYTIMDKMQYVKENMPKPGETDFTDLDDLINNLEFSLIH